MSLKDMMPAFDLIQPSDLENAFDVLGKHQDQSWILAGGQDTYDWLKDRVKRPTVLVDLAGIAELKGISERADGVEIGALTTLSEIAEHPLVAERYPVLATAAGRVASPQIRNAGTFGGNLCQDARCWYYRAGMDCYRAGGNTCYADSPEGMNREHCLFEADRCVAVSPSDTATAAVVLDAEMVIQSSKGERVVPAAEFFVGPDVDIERMTMLEPGEVLTSVRLPAIWAGTTQYFEKVADRNTWDFALVSIAAAIRLDGTTITDVRLACGGVQCVPRRLTVVEDIVRGSEKTEETAELAARSSARGATTLNFNHFKIPLMENLVKRAIRDS